MRNSIDHKLLGCVLIVAAIILGLSFWWGVETANASTELQPTARDWQRLNACAQYVPQYEGTVEDVIRCAAIGKGISRFESANGQSRVAKVQNNHYGIMAFPKKGGRYLKTYKTTAIADLDYARIWWKFYRTTKISKLALAWTGEPWVAKKYAAKVKEWYGIYEPMYRKMAESK
jgi:hypothetical protein